MRGAAPRPGLFASTDFNNNDKRVYFYGRNNLYPLAAAPGYGIADLSCNLVWQMISLYLMFFYTDVMGLPAYYVGLMFLVTRLVDGVADVLMGLVIDNTATRWGRCRPYLLIGAIPFGLLCILAFYVPDFGTTGKLIYAFITYLCLSFLYTIVNIPFCAMLPFLTNDSRERTTLSAVRILLGSLGATIVAVATLPLVGALGKAISSTASSTRRWFSALLPPSSCW